ncbi:GntR family transcriptional regulator [Niveibacterium sp. SC-1]|uniref:GntR family transcriptional regulator n=1 Tax=Niveibacterium sp. SC-1 TaxID=3135646 RepID=UPI00311DCCED
MARKGSGAAVTVDAIYARLLPDAQDSTPLYLQLHRALAAAIRDGVFQPSEALPSERVLAERVGVSRVTARKAVDALADDGLIVRRHGSGNYISPRLEQPLLKLTGFTEELRQRGFVPSSRWLRRIMGAALPEEALALGLSPATRVARLERVRLADDVPMAYEVSALPAEVLARPQDVEDSLYRHLEGLGCAPVRALQHIRAINASPRHAELLDIPNGQALLYITRVAYGADERAIEYTQTFCRSDYYDLIAELRR